MSSSPIITVAGFNLAAGIGTATAAYMPDVTALRGANSIEQIVTVGGLTLRTLTLFLIGGQTDTWQLASGDYDSSDPTNSVRPLDYNAVTNNVHWQHAGGFGSALLVGARVTTAAAVNIVSGVPTAVSFTAARFNSGEWDPANPSRITAIQDGIYAVGGSASFAANVSGQRTLELRKNGSITIASDKKNASASVVVTNMALTSVVQLTAGDYIELIATQTSGGTLDVLKADQYSPELSVTRITSLVPSASGTLASASSTPVSDGTTGNVEQALSITDAGWYRIWAGAYPASGNFNIRRVIQADGQTSDTSVDFTIIAGSPEGIINISRNSVPSTGSPSIDGVRVLHSVSDGLAYVEAHLLRGGSWILRHSTSDTNFLDAPFLVADIVVADGSLSYGLKPNVTGGTGTIDVPAVQSSGNNLVRPQAGVTWAAATGTPARTTFDTSTATLTQVAQRLKAIIDDLIFAGLFQQGIPSSMIYTDMLALASSLVAENVVANVTDIFRVSVAPDTTVQGIYIPVGTFNGHNFYKIQGYEYEAAGQNSPRQCYWSTAWATWTISNASGNLYHDAATNANPWSVAQWKDQASANVAVTTVAPNIPLTYNALTDTHTAMILTGSLSGYNGLYLRGADLNAKRRYYLVGTSSNNKRIEWTGSAWNIKDDSSTYATASDAVTFPDQVMVWAAGSDAVKVQGINAVDLMSGLTVGDPASLYNGIYVPVQGMYNSLAGRNLVYRRTDGAYFIQATGNPASVGWSIGATLGANTVGSDTSGNFPYNVSWVTAGLTVQQNKIASPGWVNGAPLPNTNITGNITGNWHL